jgi:hypothetical protein
MAGERRRSERKQVLLEARWESMSRSHEARIDDVSAGGCFVNTFGHVEINEGVNLQILRPSGDWLRIQGRVASYLPGVGFGMAFGSLNEEQTTVLRELILSAEERKI